MMPHSPLPPLILNRLLVQDLMQSDAPCFALGYVSDGQSLTGFIGMRPASPIPPAVTQPGFRLGHSIRGNDQEYVLHFAFEFYDHAVYSGLVNPDNVLINSVLAKMLETQDYFFLAINPDNTVTAFRSQWENDDLIGLKANLAHYSDHYCTPAYYEKAYRSYTQNPEPAGHVMAWACRDNPDYLNLAEAFQLVLNPRT